MILPAQRLHELCLRDPPLLAPFCRRTRYNGVTHGLGPAGYDIRIAQTIDFSIHSRFHIASTIEHFNMPRDILGVVMDKSTWARKGLSLFNTVIEPGWHGFLTIEMIYHGDEPLRIDEEVGIAQVLFHKLSETTHFPYEGKYQDQTNQPVFAIFEQ